MEAQKYNNEVMALVSQAISKMKSASTLMKNHGDTVRAMDLDEAIGYATAAIEEED